MLGRQCNEQTLPLDMNFCVKLADLTGQILTLKTLT